MSRELEFRRKLDKLAEMAPENRHSYFQLKYFVIGKEPTLQAQMWQCLRELQARRDTLESLELEIEDAKDQLELIKLDIEQLGEASSDFERRQKEIKLRRLERQVKSVKKNLSQLTKQQKFVTQEARFFVQTFEYLEKIEPVKDFDDLESQEQYWNEVISQKVNLKMLLQQPLDTELVQTALALHETAPAKLQITQMLDRIHHQMLAMREQRRERLKGKEDDAGSKKTLKSGPPIQNGQIIGVPATGGQQGQPVLSEE